MKQIQLQIEGMSCGHCKKHVEEAFAAKAGVTEVSVNLENGSASISYDENIVDEANIRATLDETTYSVVS